MTTSEVALQALRAEHERGEQLLQLHTENRDRARTLEQAATQLIEAALTRLHELEEAIADMEVAGWRVDTDPESTDVEQAGEQ